MKLIFLHLKNNGENESKKKYAQLPPALKQGVYSTEREMIIESYYKNK